MRQLIRALVCAALLATASCSSTSSSEPERLTYKQAVKKIGRPPTRSALGPDGSLIATWETEIRGGKRLLVMKFDSNRRLESSETK